MKTPHMRRGSALLMVLGMLSFLIISAVSFSMFMRQSRVPSSFLRQKIASRMLAKAALARVMNDIDTAIGNCPHPGVGGTLGLNQWNSRVFMGATTNSSTGVSTADTVPTLTLEALAYLPPPLVNAVRYWSRRSPTSAWQTFSYDAGRYAYTAVDVSDYFDVNRALADRGRSSAASSCISLAYLFEQGANHENPPEGAQNWDDFMKSFGRTVDDETDAISFNSVPCVSLADFNMALGSRGALGDFKSYFYDYVFGGGASKGFYNSNGYDDEERIRRMTFVTDSLSAGHSETTLASGTTSSGRSVVDLTDTENQPIPMTDLAKDEPPSLTAIFMREYPINGAAGTTGDSSTSSNTMDDWKRMLSWFGIAALWDYLDYDNYPLSLCLPTTERVPMICGLQYYNDSGESAQIKVQEKRAKIVEGAINKSDDGSERKRCSRTVTYSLDLSEVAGCMKTSFIRALVAYPFLDRYDRSNENFDYECDGRASLFLSSETMPLRVDSETTLLRCESEVGESGLAEGEVGLVNCKLIMDGPLSDPRKNADEITELSCLRDPLNTQFSLRDMAGPLSGSSSSLPDPLATTDSSPQDNGSGDSDNLTLLKVTYYWTQSRRNESDNWAPTWDDWYQTDSFNVVDPSNLDANGIDLASLECKLRPFNADGEIDADTFAKGSDALLKYVTEGDHYLDLNLAVWLRIKNSDAFVDAVPATLKDDDVLNSASAGMLRTRVNDVGGRGYALMKFQTGANGTCAQVPMNLKLLKQLSSGSVSTFTVERSTMYCPDPRWNYAPEQWVSSTEALTRESWLKYVQENFLGKAGRANDIFMATSDQGYLQSIYELLILPRFKALGSEPEVGEVTGDADGLAETKYHIAEKLDDVVNEHMMWSVFDPIDDDNADFKKLPFRSGGRGLKVNPYTDSTNVLMAAFANTPLDWSVASTNTRETLQLRHVGAAQFNKKYAFCDYAEEPSAQISWSDLKGIAGVFCDRMRQGNVYDWESCWCDLFDNDFSSSSTRSLWGCSFDGSPDVRLWDVDKRFLYGYWHDCFAADQQLFLVFFRSEPLMMGGGAVGLVPPQLGARAMALVWRDPKAPDNGGTQHRMRVLFYHQFD